MVSSITLVFEEFNFIVQMNWLCKLRFVGFFIMKNQFLVVSQISNVKYLLCFSFFCAGFASHRQYTPFKAKSPITHFWPLAIFGDALLCVGSVDPYENIMVGLGEIYRIIRAAISSQRSALMFYFFWVLMACFLAHPGLFTANYWSDKSFEIRMHRFPHVFWNLFFTLYGPANSDFLQQISTCLKKITLIR